jgi:hypothetical protein
MRSVGPTGIIGNDMSRPLKLRVLRWAIVGLRILIRAQLWLFEAPEGPVQIIACQEAGVRNIPRRIEYRTAKKILVEAKLYLELAKWWYSMPWFLDDEPTMSGVLDLFTRLTELQDEDRRYGKQ